MDIQLTQNVYANSILLYNYFHIKVGVSIIVELKKHCYLYLFLLYN